MLLNKSKDTRAKFNPGLRANKKWPSNNWAKYQKIASACNTQQSYPALRKSTLFKQFSTVECLNNYSIFFNTAIQSPRVMGHIFELAHFRGFSVLKRSMISQIRTKLDTVFIRLTALGAY